MKKIIFIIGILFIFSNAYTQSGWFFQNSGFSETGALNQVFFSDSNNGWIGGQFEMISKTLNGGTNWIPVQNAGYHHYSIFFINNNTGWISTGVNSIIVLLKTTNNGINWLTIETQNQSIYDIFFINENTGWAASSGKILKTTNGGDIWNQFIMPGNIYYWFQSLSFINSETGWSSGTYFNEYTYEYYSAVIKTTNAGNSWFFVREESPDIYRNYRNIQFLNTQTGYLNRIPPSKTTDGGQTWFNIIDSSYYFSMYFINVNTGWFGTSGGSIIKTTNGGQNWITNNIANGLIFHKLFFIDPNTGWVVGMSNISQNIVLKTTTGGISFISSISSDIPDKFSLSQNYPNPFNPGTIIKFQIKDSRLVTLKVYDILEKEVITLVNEKLKPAEYETAFYGDGLPSGIYFYSLYADGKLLETKKMVLLK